jgi:hypothetical protein
MFWIRVRINTPGGPIRAFSRSYKSQSPINMSMLVVLALLGRGRGLPVLTITDDSAASQAASCDDLRTRSSILWTCLVTVLSCTWVSIHPNVPGPDEKWLKVALRRVGLMVGTLIAPELIIAWAMRQRIAARRLAKRLEKGKQ